MVLAGPEDGSGTAAEAGDYEGMPEAASDADMMKSESLSTAAAAAIAARAAAAARLREEEQKRRLLEEEAVGACQLAACLYPSLSCNFTFPCKSTHNFPTGCTSGLKGVCLFLSVHPLGTDRPIADCIAGLMSVPRLDTCQHTPDCAARLMSMREERSGKRQRGGEARNLDHSELHSPTVQEIADFLDVEMSPRTKMGLQGMPAGASAAAAAQAGGASQGPESTKHVVESQTGQDSIDDGYRWD